MVEMGVGEQVEVRKWLGVAYRIRKGVGLSSHAPVRVRAVQLVLLNSRERYICPLLHTKVL